MCLAGAPAATSAAGMEQEGGNDLEDGAAHATITRREYAAHQLFQQLQDSDHIFRGARLFQELLCDQYATMEQAKLHWYRTRQREIRADLYSGLRVSHDLIVIVLHVSECWLWAQPHSFICASGQLCSSLHPVVRNRCR